MEAMRTQNGAETRPLAVPDRQCYPTLGRLQDSNLHRPSICQVCSIKDGERKGQKRARGDCLSLLFSLLFKTSEI